MDITAIRQAIQATKLEVWVVDDKYPAKWSLRFKAGDKSGLTFHYLGGGTNKLAFRVDQRDSVPQWVLTFQAVPDKEDKAKDIKDEIEILKVLAEHRVLVPEPIATKHSAKDHAFSFTIENHDSDKEGTVYGYIMEYFDLVSHANPKARYIEMRKSDGDLPNWLEKKVLSATPEAKMHLRTTIKIFDLIAAEFERKPWGDFQVIYDKADGRLLVFDPYPDITNAFKTVAILKKWKEDLEKASQTL